MPLNHSAPGSANNDSTGEPSMALFTKSDPIAAAVIEHAKLASLEADAKMALDIVEDNANASAAKGADDATVKADNSKVQECRDLLARRHTALERKDAEIVTLTSARDEKVDGDTRHATANEIETQLRAGNATAKKFDAVMEEMAAFAAWSAAFIPEAAGLQNYCKASRAQIPEAMTMIGKMAAYHAEAVLAKTAPATLRRPEAPFVPTVIAKPERVTLFATRSVKYTDPDSGKLIVIQKFQDGEFPPIYARAALEAKVCTRLSDPMRQKHHGTTGGHASVELAYDLDALMKAAKPAAIDPIMASAPPQPPSQFEVSDYGRKPVVLMKVVG
jgi:hypothetical protein